MKNWRRTSVGASRIALCLLLVLASGCASLPPLDGRVESTALRDSGRTQLGKAIEPLAARNGARPPEMSFYRETGKPVMAGLYALAGGREALAARVVLADAAEQGLDIQYYFWRDDRSGTFLFNAVRRAADRGVRVRLLIDDNNTVGQDALFRALDRHPNIEVRLFNPFAQRGVRMLGFLTDFERLNRRMHNKSFTADNQATIIGGRNIGDEYFDETDEAAFADLDVLAVGAIVDQVSTDFDRYWSSESAYPVDRLLKPAAEEAMDGLMARVGEAEQGSEFQDYSEAVKKNALLRELFEGSVRLEWAMTRIVSDDPGKVLKRSTDKVSLPAKMQELIGKPRHLLEMVSPYFVPMQQGLDYLLSLHSDGVRIRVLTNSLASTDVVAVHSGYARWRKPLLQGGIALYEYKPGAPTPRSGAGARGWERRAGDGMGRQGWRTPNAVSRDVSAGAGGPSGEDGSPAMRGSVSVAPTPSAGTAAGDGRSGSGDLPGSPRQAGLSVSNVSSVSSVSRASRGSGGSSSSSLHAKTFSVDRSRVVIGSFNFDPRSFDLNTELSVVIDSPALASSVEEAYSRNVPLTAWQVTRTEPGELQWTEEKDGVQVRHDREPGAGFWRRVGAKAFGLLQIDWLL